MSKQDFNIYFQNGKVINIKIPDTWKITFGPLHPGKQIGQCAVRVYSGNNKLKAIYVNTESFEDVKINKVVVTEEPQRENWVEFGVREMARRARPEIFDEVTEAPNQFVPTGR